MSIEPDETTKTQPTDPATWVDEFGDFFYRFAYSRLRDPNSAEEAVQETFVAGIRSFGTYEGKATTRNWLMGILKRKIIDIIRQRQRASNISGIDGEADPEQVLFDSSGHWRRNATAWANEPSKNIHSGELWDVVQKCLTKLPVGQSDVFTLSVIEGLETQEICEQLGITESNLWVRLHRARMQLAQCVGPMWKGL